MSEGENEDGDLMARHPNLWAAVWIVFVVAMAVLGKISRGG